MHIPPRVDGVCTKSWKVSQAIMKHGCIERPGFSLLPHILHSSVPLHFRLGEEAFSHNLYTIFTNKCPALISAPPNIYQL